jgi:hypothetical protein
MQANGTAPVTIGVENGNDEVGEAESDDQPVVGTPAAQPEPSAGLGSEPPVSGGGHVDQPRCAAREEILGPVGDERHTITREGVDEIPPTYVRCRAPTPMSGE